MRHCQQCRADAVGMLGEDRGAEFSLDKIEAMQIDETAALARRLALRAAINAELAAKRAARRAQDAQVIALPRAAPVVGRPVRMAVASSTGEVIDSHFGHAKAFHIVEVTANHVQSLGIRNAVSYCGGEEACGEAENTLMRTLATLADCEVMLCSRIGIDPWGKLEAAGLCPDSSHAMEPVALAARAVWQAMLDHGKLAQSPAQVRRA
jgi:nitrogen fixation protein NifB